MESSIRRVSWVILAIVMVLAASALPAAAHPFGPAFFCDTGTLNNCTDTIDAASAEDTFSCEGKVGDVVSCTNQLTGESSPYCKFMGDELSSENRDAYMCGPASDLTNQTVDMFWQEVDAAQGLGGV